jgi:serine/threonine-protein kinase
MDEIGAGAYGRVYRAWDEALAREVALKVIRVDVLDQGAAPSLLREGQMLARVRHRNVVTVYGARQIDNEVGIWMELVRGRPLSRMVRDDGPMGAEEAAVVGISLCDALAAVHGAGLLHRDIKAQNVMRESGGRIVLMDFGAGRDVSGAREGWNDMSGTPLYMAPEVLAGAGWSPAADVYSLGVLLFFLVTGRYPIEGRTMSDIAIAHGLGRRQLLADSRPGLPEGFVKVVERALTPQPDRRYRSAGAMMRELAEAIPGGSGSWRDELSANSAVMARPAGDSGSSGTMGAPSGDAAFVRPVTTALVVVAAIWLLGFLNSAAYNQTLGRGSEFAGESMLEWLIWGVRALIGPALYVALALIVYRVGRGVWRGMVRFVGPARFAAAAVRTRMSAAAQAMGFSSRTVRAQWLVGLHLIATIVVCWLFSPLIMACTAFLSTAPAWTLAELRPDNDAHIYYRAVWSVLLLVFGVAWGTLLRRAPDEAPVERSTLGAGLALMALTLVLLDVPFRLLYQSLGQRVALAGERCYDIGQAHGDVLLFCPGTVPRTRMVAAADSRLRRDSVVESIFTPAATPTGQ